MRRNFYLVLHPATEAAQDKNKTKQKRRQTAVTRENDSNRYVGKETKNGFQKRDAELFEKWLDTPLSRACIRHRMRELRQKTTRTRN